MAGLITRFAEGEPYTQPCGPNCTFSTPRDQREKSPGSGLRSKPTPRVSQPKCSAARMPGVEGGAAGVGQDAAVGQPVTDTMPPVRSCTRAAVAGVKAISFGTRSTG